MVLSDLNLELRKEVKSSPKYQVSIGKFCKCRGLINACTTGFVSVWKMVSLHLIRVVYFVVVANLHLLFQLETMSYTEIYEVIACLIVLISHMSICPIHTRRADRGSIQLFANIERCTGVSLMAVIYQCNYTGRSYVSLIHNTEEKCKVWKDLQWSLFRIMECHRLMKIVIRTLAIANYTANM